MTEAGAGTRSLETEGHRLYVVGGPEGSSTRREVLPGEDALEVAVSFGFADDPALPKNEVWARAFSFLCQRATPEGSFVVGETTGRRLDASVQGLLEARETLALLDEAAPDLARLLEGDAEALDGFDAAHAALTARAGELEGEIRGLTGRLERLVEAHTR